MQGMDFDTSLGGLAGISAQLSTTLEDKLLRSIDLFRMCDADASGNISFAEFRNVLTVEMGFVMGDYELSQVFSNLDRDKSGMIAYEELHAALKKGTPVHLSTWP